MKLQRCRTITASSVIDDHNNEFHLRLATIPTVGSNMSICITSHFKISTLIRLSKEFISLSLSSIAYALMIFCILGGYYVVPNYEVYRR